MAVTIRDIARKSGFSISTVSRALANPEQVAEGTRREVQTIASRMGYRIRRHAAPDRHYRVGLVVPDLENPFFGSICKAAQRRARALGCMVLVADTDEDVLSEAEIAREIAERVDGVILCSPRMSDTDIRKLAAETPVTLANRHLPGIPSVIFDNAGGMNSALSHLVALGHRHIGYVGGPVASWTNTQRANAFDAFSDRNPAEALELVNLGNFPPYFQGGVQAADLAVASAVSAVIAYNDLMAVGLMDRLGSRGVSVPDGMSVIGFDDVAVCMFVRPNLTTVNLPRLQMGKTSIDMLYRLIRDPDHTGHDAAADVKGPVMTADTERTLAVELRVRQSSSAVGPVNGVVGDLRPRSAEA